MDIQRVEEARWLAKAKNGDREALDRLISHYWQPMYRLLLSKVGHVEDAKELTQEAFMKAFRSLPQYEIRKEGSFKSYLGRIAVNLVIDFWRKQGRAPQIVDISDYQEVLMDRKEKPEEHTLRQEGQRQMLNLVETLPLEQRQAVYLRILQGLPIRDVAAKMNKTEGAIKMLQMRALKNLRELCTGMEIGK